MKKIIFSSILMHNAIIYSQVGIGTNNPLTNFHIDAGKDNPLIGTIVSDAQKQNDVAILSSGNVGIGNLSATRKLEIESGTVASPSDGFKLKDGTEGKGKVLISDDSGSAHWLLHPAQKIYKGVMGNGLDVDISSSSYSFNPANHSVGFYQTGSYIDLPPGKWRVKIDLVIPYLADSDAAMSRDEWFWMRTTLSDSGTNNPAAPSADLVNNSRWASEIFQGPGPVLSAGNKFAMINGNLIINNTASGIKRYYLLAGGFTRSNLNIPGILEKMGGAQWQENKLTAYAIEQD
ncbi:hypothetical protein [Chryseobacterium taihuense]|uniref:Uncharacterized protein n=1 Tax=Chryseobacterium taihuense TaxID=1141221 RepID=A0ABY0QWQ1_9FLAO|nr:hypothetical protein [Chryseobacterium taihuense]SDM03330.1 hypothetical protein SAMN05216273_11143 [Chryseobacterium taihuense]